MEKRPKSRNARWWLIAAVLVVVLFCLIVRCGCISRIVFVYNHSFNSPLLTKVDNE